MHSCVYYRTQMYTATANIVAGNGCSAFSDLLREKRISMGLSQRKFARRLGVTGGAVSSWENRRRVPRAETVPDLSNALGLDPCVVARSIVASSKD